MTDGRVETLRRLASLSSNNNKRSDVGERARSRTLLSTTCTMLAAGVLLVGASDVRARQTVEPLAEPADATLPSGSSAVGDVIGEHPSVSGDGRYVVYHGAPDPRVDGASDSRSSTVYLTDRETGETTELISVPPGLRSGETYHPVISGDGCVVAVVTELALDVFRDDDTGARWDVYRSTLPHCDGIAGDWELVSTRNGSGGLARDDVTVARASLNRSGSLVAYTHPADQLYEADSVSTISIVNLTVPVADANRSRLVAGQPADSPNNVYNHRGLDQPTLSDDGGHLAYRSDATSAEAVPGWGEGPVEGETATPQIFVWDIAEPDPFVAVQLVSATPAGAPSIAGASQPSMSRDGTSVAFTSPDTTLVAAQYPACVEGCPTQVFVLDRDADDDGVIDVDVAPSLRLVSAVVGSEPPVAGVAPSSQAAISADGQVVAFVTKATNLQLIQAPGIGSGDDGEILLAELRRGALTRITTATDGVLPTAGVHAHPDISDTGRTTVYDTSAASQLLADGAVGGRQIVAKSSLPQLTLAAVDIGTTVVGLESDEWYAAVVNDGPATFRPATVTLDNPLFTINVESDENTCLLGAAVPAGGSCTVALSYVPTAEGPSTGTLTVAEEGFDAVEVSTTVTGAGGEPALRIEPAGVEFALTKVGEPSVELQVDVANISILSTRLGSFELKGEHPDDFDLTSNNCYGRPLNSKAVCSVGITFTPSAAGRRTALLELGTITGQYTSAILVGDGEYAPVVQLDAPSVAAGWEVVATGSQYPANSEVTVVFGDGPQSTVTAVTDDTGSFEVNVPVASTERGGNRTIVVQTTSGAAASAPVEVIDDDQQFIGLPGFGLGG